jgi:hypothetical protein
MITTIAARVPGRHLHVVADAACHGKSLRDLPARITWTTRLPHNAVLYHRAPAPQRETGTPRTKGDRIDTPYEAADTAVSGKPDGGKAFLCMERCGDHRLRLPSP